MNPSEIPEGHGFKTGWKSGGLYRVLCVCGERFAGSDSATAHAYWREHIVEVTAGVDR